MPTPVSRLAFADCYELFDRAIESPRGIQRMFQTRGEAINFRNRLHKARTEDRANNRRVYEEEDPLYNQTIYAQITVREPRWDEVKEKWVLKLEKSVVEEMEVEEIPGPEVEKEAAE